ncbi:MAG: response regulator [Desulfovibrio sp.]|nr:MAG: response regulator [Desulfovibrio sp.]
MTHSRILLVEDEPTHVRLFKDILEETHATVHVAGDGFEALEAMKSATFDLVLMDLRLPRMGGMETTRRIRESGPPHRDVPIIGMTAFTMPQDAEIGSDLGLTQCVAKPVDPDRFLATVSKYLPHSNLNSS